jgi:signal transduction histidine kinase
VVPSATGPSLPDAVLGGVPAGIAVIDGASLTVRWANPAFVALLDERDQARGAVGLALGAIPAARAASLPDRVRFAVASGVPVTHLEAETRAPGRAPRAWRFTIVPLARDGGLPDAMLLAIDITEQVEARRRAEALASLAADLSRGHRLAHVLATGLQRARALLSGRVALWTVEDGRLRAADLPGGPDGDAPLRADAPTVAEALATGRAMLLTRTAATEDERAWLLRSEAGAALFVPLVADERAHGVLVVARAEEAAPPAEEVALAGAVAAQIALAASKMTAIELERFNAARLAILQAATAAFSAARTTDDVARALFDHGSSAIEADFATLVLLRAPGRLDTVAARGLSADELEFFRSFPTAAPFPTAAAVRLRAAVWLDDAEEMDRQFPALIRARRGARHLAWAALPLMVRGEPMGGVGLAWKRPHRFPPEERRFVLALVDQCAQAIDRARLLDAERRARVRLALSSELAAALATARTREDVVRVVFGAGLATFDATAAAYWDREGDVRLRLLGCQGYPPLDCAPWREVPIDAVNPVAEAARTGEPIWLPAREAVEARYGLGAVPRRARAVAVVPLSVAERSHGVLALFYDEAHAFDEEERRFVAWLAGKLAEALERALFYESERRARERAEAAEAEARRIGELQERLMAVVGHDLRTPLSAITLATRVLFRQGLGPEASVTVGRIATSAARMAAIVRDLVDVARIRSGQGLSLERRRVDVAPVCERVVRELADLHPDRTVTLAQEGDTALEADADRLAQLVSNLVANALHHGGADARVSVRVEGAADEVRVLVSDNGAGIPPERLEEMFEPFQPGGGGGGHLGLGLFIVREIARAHGGDVLVRSGAGVGTAFTVRLPRGGGRPG